MPIQKLTMVANDDYASCTCDDSVITALKPLCEGQIDVFESSGLQGTLGAAPAKFNSKRIVAGKKTGRAYKSNSFSIPHVKTTIGASEIRTAATGKLKADIQATVNADYIRVSYDSKGVA